MPDPQTTDTGRYVRMMLAAGLAYAAMAMPISSLGVYVTRDWGMSNFLAGLAAGAAFCTAIFRRKPAGDLADRRGGRFSFVRGCVFHAAGGCVCLLAAWEGPPVPVRYALIVLGRLVVGLGESMANVGMAHWLVGFMGVERTGRIFATLGMSIYGAVAVSGRTGFFLFERYGFAGVMAASICAPLVGYLLVRTIPYDRHGGGKREGCTFREVMTRLWRLGIPASCVAVGFAVVGAFLTKTFLDRGWAFAGWAFTCCGLGFVVMRVFIGHLPDRIGGLRVARMSALVEMIGLYLLWLAPGPLPALLGSFLTGAGISIIFPSLSMEIVKSVPARMRGACISSYNIFIDLSYGFAAPIAGFFTDRLGDSFAYLFAAVCATTGFAMIHAVSRTWRRGGDGPAVTGDAPCA